MRGRQTKTQAERDRDRQRHKREREREREVDSYEIASESKGPTPLGKDPGRWGRGQHSGDLS